VRFAYGPADATATPSFLASLKSRMVLSFRCRLTQVVLEKSPLNGCLSCVYLQLEQFGVVGRLDEVALDGQRQRVSVLGGRNDEAGRAGL